MMNRRGQDLVAAAHTMDANRFHRRLSSSSTSRGECAKATAGDCGPIVKMESRGYSAARRPGRQLRLRAENLRDTARRSGKSCLLRRPRHYTKPLNALATFMRSVAPG